MQTYIVELKRGEEILWSRTRHQMPAAVDAAVAGNYELHDRLSTRDSKAAWIDYDCVNGWVPRTADVVIVRQDLTLICRRA